MYDSPKQLRRRQQEADRAHGMSLSRQRRIPVISDAMWAATCDHHVGQIYANADDSRTVHAHARALVHMALQRRAYELMRQYGRAYWKAMQMARAEMYSA
jgi:hypothetical protein